MNIKCLIYSRYSTSSQIYMVNKEPSIKALTVDAEKVLPTEINFQMSSKIKALKSKSNERDKLRTAYGNWFVTHDDNDVCYAVCTT